MPVLSKPLMSVIVISIAALALLTSMASAESGTRRYTDKQKHQEVTIRANKTHVRQATFATSKSGGLKCDDGGSVHGGWSVENVEVHNGSFHAVKEYDPTEFLKVKVVFQGKLSRNTIRGNVSVRTQTVGTGKKPKCWSGRSWSSPTVQYIAKAR
jgi:hypothetical protein